MQLSALSQLTALRLLGQGTVAAGSLQQLPSSLKELQVTVAEGSQQLSLTHLTAHTQLQLSGNYKLSSSNRLPATLKQLASWLPALTELHLAYNCISLSSPLNLAAESAAWPGLPLRQLSLNSVAVPAAMLQRMAELPGGLTSLQLHYCDFDSTPRQVATVLAGMHTLRSFRMGGLFRVLTRHSNTLLAGTRELLRTLGRMQLHTLEIRNMPLGNIVMELTGDPDWWAADGCSRQLPYERLVLSNYRLNNLAAFALLQGCSSLRELSLQYNGACRDGLDDSAFGVGRWLTPVQLPQLQWLDVRGTAVTPAGVAHLPGTKLLDARHAVSELT